MKKCGNRRIEGLDTAIKMMVYPVAMVIGVAVWIVNNKRKKRSKGK